MIPINAPKTLYIIAYYDEMNFSYVSRVVWQSISYKCCYIVNLTCEPDGATSESSLLSQHLSSLLTGDMLRLVCHVRRTLDLL